MAVAGSDLATCHSRVCPGPGSEPHEEEAASVTRPACSMVCSCSGSGHHLECPPAVLQCCSQPRPLNSSGTSPRPTANSSSGGGAGSVAKSWLFSQNRTELTPRTLEMEHSVFFSSLLMGLLGVCWCSGLLKTLHHQPGAANESHYARTYSFATLHLVIINTRKENGESKVDGLS